MVSPELPKHNYIQYLVTQYNEFALAAKSFGHPKEGWSHGAVHRNVRSKFGSSTYLVPVERFEEVVAYVQSRINKTILGKTNKAHRIPNYESFEEFVLKQRGE